MATKIKYSDYLSAVLKRAESIGAELGPAPLTAERFIVALFDQLSTTLPMDGELDRELRTTLYSDPSVKHRLLDFCKGATASNPEYCLYMQSKLSAAADRAKEQKMKEVTVGLLLQTIYADPCESLQAILFGAPFPTVSAAAAPATPAPEPSAPQAEGTSVRYLEELTQKVRRIRRLLTERIFGQEKAISVVTSGYFKGESFAISDPNRTKPRATFLLAGPPGVGKTYLAETAAKLMNLPFCRFDMSEYADAQSAIEFAGSDSVYKNAGAGIVTDFVRRHPNSVLIFDEIEKAHINVIHLFLQILDTGRLRDSHLDVEVSFKNTYIFFTTNAGKRIYENSETGNYSDLSRKVIMKAIEKDTRADGSPFFPAAICSRFLSGNVVMFNHVNAGGLRAIAEREAKRNVEGFKTSYGVDVEIDDRAFSALLFAEGGSADGRTIRGRAQSFFSDEIFELLRLVASGKRSTGIADVRRIRIEVDLRNAASEVSALFEPQEPTEILLFTDEVTAKKCRKNVDARGLRVLLHTSDDPAEAMQRLREHPISAVCIDMTCGREKENEECLNAEDVKSRARDFLLLLRENDREMPFYLLESEREDRLSEEELYSFYNRGARGVAFVATKGTADKPPRKGTVELAQICRILNEQSGMRALSRSNSLLSYETSQLLVDGGNTALIRLFDFHKSVAIDAEDAETVLSKPSRPTERFDAIIGAEEAKRELRNFIQYLQNPKKYRGTGMHAPRGVLLYGPPGTGKTLLAKALASESNATFIAAEGNQFMKRFVGEGPESVHALFRTARKYAPSILFIDEIDAIATERTGRGHSEDVLTAFLTEMDGFHSDPTRPVFVLAATNFEVTPGTPRSIDGALLRRFDRHVFIDLPTKDERMQYFRERVKENPSLAISDGMIENLATRSTGMSLASLSSIIELALRSAFLAASETDGKLSVTDEILEKSFETFHSGTERTVDRASLKRTAIHEAGHALLCWLSGETPSYLTVVPRGVHGGYMQRAESERKYRYTKSELFSHIRTALGGRAAEIVCFGDTEGISTGASSDLHSATETALKMVSLFGMDETIGLAVFDNAMESPSAEVVAVVNRILAESLTEARAMIEANRPALDAIVDELMKGAHLTGAELEPILTKYAPRT